MRRKQLGLLALLLVTVTLPAAAAGTRILLVARDHEEHPLSGFRFAYQGLETLPTSQAGATELDLPPEHRPGQSVKILLLVPKSKQAEEWFLVNSLVNIPAPGIQAEVVLMRRSAVREIAAEVRDARRQGVSGQAELTAEDRKRVLVETAARHGLNVDQLETALRSFAETQDPKDKGIAAYMAGEFAKAEGLLNQAAEKKESDFVETLRYLGASQYEQAKYRLAAATFRKAEGLRGEDPVLLSWLGITLDELAEWAEAEPLKRRALAIAEKSFGTEHPEVAAALNNLATLLKATNRLGEAEPLMRRALAIYEKSFGTEHPNVAAALNNLAMLLQATNRLGEAEPLMRRALAIDEKSFGTEHPEVADRLNNLAQLLQDTNRLGEAEPLMRRALTIDEKSFGTEHPNVARDLNNLAALLHNTNRLGEAEPLMRRALAIDEKSFGTEHPEVAGRLNNLAALLHNTNRLGEAEPLMRRALAIDEKSFGTEHPEVATDLNNLATLLQDTNRLGEAEPLMRRALAIDEKSFGTEHPEIAVRLNNLARLLLATNRLGEAEPLMRRALAIDEKSFGTEHPEIAVRLNDLAALLLATNRLGEAEPLMRRSLVIFLDFTRRTGHQHPYLQTVNDNYRALLQAMGKSDAEIEAALAGLVGTSE